MVGVMAVMETSFKRTHVRTVGFSAPDPTAGQCQSMPLPEAPGHSQEGLTQSPVGSLLLSPRSWCAQGFLCALQESVSPLLWKFCNQIPLAFKIKFPGGFKFLCWISRLGNLLLTLELLQQCENFFGIIVLQFVGCLLSGSIVGLTCCTSQVCCNQSPCPHSRPLLTHASAGDTQTPKGRSGSVSVGFLGPGIHKVLLEASKHL